MTSVESDAAPTGLLGMNRYQWTVIFAAWLGWGFDVFDGLIFGFVAGNAVPSLLHLTIGTPEAQAATSRWNGILVSVLLLGWAAGGVLFGLVADRLGRTRTLLLTILLYSVGTACCAFAPNIWILLLFRVVAGLGIGGEWATGAALVAEVVPDNRRVEAGALLYTASPLGLFLATYTNKWITTSLAGIPPEVSWRYVMASGLLAALVCAFVRSAVHEPERWKSAVEAGGATGPVRLSELFHPTMRARTISGLIPAVITLCSWWCLGAFLPLLADALARQRAAAESLDKAQTTALVLQWKVMTNNSFDLGGLLGSLFTIPAARRLGRRRMFLMYFLPGAAAFFATFGLPLSPEERLIGYFFLGLTMFGIFGSFTFYMPELFPTRLRATGAGFCYNSGRVIAAAGPFLVGAISAQGVGPMLKTLFCVGR